MRRFPIYVNGEIQLARITDALQQAGFHVRCDVNGLTVVDEVPRIIRKDPAPSNLVLLERHHKRTV